jgi:hypothetical protein
MHPRGQVAAQTGKTIYQLKHELLDDYIDLITDKNSLKIKTLR